MIDDKESTYISRLDYERDVYYSIPSISTNEYHLSGRNIFLNDKDRIKNWRYNKKLQKI